MFRRWLISGTSLAVGACVSVGLLVFASPERGLTAVYAAAHDLAAGAPLGDGSLALVRVNADGLAGGLRAQLFTAADHDRLARLHAAHDLVSGQLIQRSDILDAANGDDRRLVFVPVKDTPAAPVGSKIDLLVVQGAPDHLSVSPFASGVEVRESVAGGLVVVVSAGQAAGFVYAANAMHLVAVVAEPGASGGPEAAVSTVEQAMALAAEP
jgi:hypothetical protein